MCILQAEGLSIRLGGRQILRGIDLSVQSGKRTAVIGPNGSGKSTLLKALAGLLHPSAGRVFFARQDIRSYGKRQLARHIAILPQSSSAPRDLTVRDLVDYGRFPHRDWLGRSSGGDKAIVDWALAQTGLLRFAKRLLCTLSGGERQRAWIAMALAQQPSVLFLDEPTTYLDVAHQLEVMQTIEDLNKSQAISVVMVLHDLNHAARYADEAIVVKDGGVCAQGKPKQIIDLALLERVFKVKAELFKNERGESLFIPQGVLRNGDTF